MKTFEYDIVGRVVVFVSGDEPPADPEWREYLAAVKKQFATEPNTVALVSAVGNGSLNTVQRKQMTDVVPPKSKVSVITASRVVRMAAVAVGWFVEGTKAFAPGEENAAVAHLGLLPVEASTVLTALERLRAALTRAK